jgi:hypothetical protein
MLPNGFWPPNPALNVELKLGAAFGVKGEDVVGAGEDGLSVFGAPNPLVAAPKLEGNPV